MRGLIVGLGSIGQRHLRNLRALDPKAGIIVWRQLAQPGPGTSGHPDASQIVHTLEEALATRPDFAIIANPAALHIETGLQLAGEGIPLLVEKPLSNELPGAETLVELCRSRNLTLTVGYNLRFHAPLTALRAAIEAGRVGRVLSVLAEVGSYLPDWRPETDYSRGASALANLGGGAILELSHELDYLRWLVGEIEAVMASSGRVGDLQIDVEDVADILLQFTGGALGNVHLDMLQRVPTRACKVIGTTGTLVWDGPSGLVRHYSAGTRAWADVYRPASLDWNEMYLAELRHFLDCVKTGLLPEVSGEDGLRVLRIALAAHESARLRRAVPLQGALPGSPRARGEATS